MTAASTPNPAASALIGTVVSERYRVLKLLGEGGMGGVYECEHVEIGKRVAVKLVSSALAKSPQIAARLKREARSTGALESEHIVQVFDAGEDPAHGLFLVMELLRGRDLASIVEGGKRIAVPEAVQIAYQAALGLEKAHENGIIHRDLKPANVFVCKRDDGRAQIKLVDFGIAKLVRDAADAALHNPGLTRAGTVIGTPQYMSPEQAQGLDTLDQRTDIYSLGAVLFEMLAGEPPHPSMPTYEQTILRIVMNDAPRASTKAPEIPRELDELVAAMLSRDPNGRPPTMAIVRQAITRVIPDVEHRRLTITAIEAPVVAGAPVANGTAAFANPNPVTPGTVMMGERAHPSQWPARTPSSMPPPGPMVEAMPMASVPPARSGSGAGIIVAFVLIVVLAGSGAAFWFVRRAPAVAPPQSTGIVAPSIVSVTSTTATPQAIVTIADPPQIPASNASANEASTASSKTARGNAPPTPKPKDPTTPAPARSGAQLGGAGYTDKF